MENLLAKNIEYLRKQRKWTQREMGERINKVRQTVANWEAGVIEPKASELELISEVFDTTMMRLMKVDMEIHGVSPRTDENEEILKIPETSEYLNFTITRFNTALNILMDIKKMRNIDEISEYLSIYTTSKITDNTLYNIKCGRTIPSLQVIGALKAAWPQFNVNYIFDQKINDAIESESNLKDVMLLLR